MFLKIITGILTCGMIPLMSLLGYGIELIVNVFTTKIIEWGYWQQALVGFIFCILTGGISIKLK